MKKLLPFLAVVLIGLFLALFFYGPFSPEEAHTSQAPDTLSGDLASNSVSPEPKALTKNEPGEKDSIIFNNKAYFRNEAYNPYEGEEIDYDIQVLDWYLEGENFESHENWSHLISTYRLQLGSLENGEAVSAMVYADSTLNHLKEGGKIILDNSFFNYGSEDESLSETSSFLIVNLKVTDSEAPWELNFQRIESHPEGGIQMLVYSQKLDLKTAEELETYFEEGDYKAIRKAVIELPLTNSIIPKISVDNPKSAEPEAKEAWIFNEHTYTQAFKLKTPGGEDFTSQSYEWITQEDTLQSWTTLITTHKLSPLSPDVPLKAEAYAQNVRSLNQTRGAVFLETSIINTPDAIAEGIDPTNPPFILVYGFPPNLGEEFVEMNYQKIINNDEGEIDILVYSEKIPFSSTEALAEYITSEKFFNTRKNVIFGKIPQ